MMKRIIKITLVILLFVSLLMIKVKASPTTYSTYLNSKNLNSTLVYEPTLILELDDLNQLNNDAKAYITSVILNVDSNMKVHVGSSNFEFATFFDTYLKGKFVPIIRLDNTIVDSFINYYKTVYTISDLMIISKDINVINKVYKDSTTYIINSIYDLTDITLPNNRYDNWQYVKDANMAGCNILMANSKDDNLDIFTEYAQAMTKVVWAKGTSTFDHINTISKGCYGVVGSITTNLIDSISYFNKTGWHHAQYIAAHRGITKYCNENSLTGCLAAYSEGATHIEVDLQVLADGNIVLCHNSQTNGTSNKNGWYFVNVLTENLKNAKLSDYNVNYDETYPTLDELIDAMLKTDIIMILELKFDNGSTKAVDELKCIENFKRILDNHPNVYGRFYAITFFAPLAEKMKEILPEVPLGYLGGAQSGKEKDLGLTAWGAGGGHKGMMNYPDKIKFLRHYNIGLDENHDAKDNSGAYLSNLSASFYLARGYMQNTWTYENTMHFTMKSNIITTNAAESCAYLVKTIDNHDLVISRNDYDNKKVNVKTYSYNGWMKENTCDIIVISEDGNNIKALLYYYQDGDYPYGLYSEIINIKIN